MSASTSVSIVPKAIAGPNQTSCRKAALNVGGNLPAEAGADWPRKGNVHRGPERPDSACRSGSGSPMDWASFAPPRSLHGDIRKFKPDFLVEGRHTVSSRTQHPGHFWFVAHSSCYQRSANAIASVGLVDNKH